MSWILLHLLRSPVCVLNEWEYYCYKRGTVQNESVTPNIKYRGAGMVNAHLVPCPDHHSCCIYNITHSLVERKLDELWLVGLRYEENRVHRLWYRDEKRRKNSRYNRRHQPLQLWPCIRPVTCLRHMYTSNAGDNAWASDCMWLHLPQ